MKKIAICLVSCVLLLSGCSGKETREQEPACSCGNYFQEQARPRWIDTEGLQNGVYYSQGIAQCTGLKTIDVKEASVNARANLSRMLQSQVQTEILLIRESNTATRSGGERGKTVTNVASKALLNNSSIYDYWVDTNSCTIYSAVKLTKSELDKAIAKETAKEEAKFKNQRFVIYAEGEYTTSLQLSLTKMLGEHGVTRITSKEDADYQLAAEIKAIDIFKEKKLVRVEIFLSVSSMVHNRVEWSAQLRGKSVSLQGFNEEYQIRQALANAFTQGDAEIRALLEKQAIE